MGIDGGNLLARLAGALGGANIGAAGASVASGTLPLGGVDFAELLRQAGAGEVSSGLRVSVAPAAGVQLSDEQLARLGVAADRAESAGMTRALALIDGMALVLEVQTRTISGQVDLASATLAGIDGAVGAGGALAGAGGPQGALQQMTSGLLGLPQAGLGMLASLLGKKA